MPKIKTSSFELFKKHGEIFVDTEDSGSNKALDASENRSYRNKVRQKPTPIIKQSSHQDEYRFMDPFHPPIVTHIIINEAYLNGELVAKPS